MLKDPRVELTTARNAGSPHNATDVPFFYHAPHTVTPNRAQSAGILRILFAILHSFGSQESTLH